ncbi:MAG: chemotaxis protein CheD [Halobacteriaceae archaeon]
MARCDPGEARGTGADGPERVAVGVADYAVATGDVALTTSGLGSCLGIALYDPETGVAGLEHAMLPRAADSVGGDPAKFVDTGVDALLEEMAAAGADPARVEAKIAGGADMLSFSGDAVGSRNADAAREVLPDRGVRIVAADVGGSRGRSLSFCRGTLSVRNAGDVRSL